MPTFNAGNNLSLSYTVVDAICSPAVCTVLVCHGYGLCGSLYAPLVQLLPETWRIVAVDHYSHGHSSDVAKPHLPDEDLENARDEARLMEHLGVQKYFVAGHSFGGRVAGLITAQNPQRYSSQREPQHIPREVHRARQPRLAHGSPHPLPAEAAPLQALRQRNCCAVRPQHMHGEGGSCGARVQQGAVGVPEERAPPARARRWRLAPGAHVRRRVLSRRLTA